MKNPRTLKCDAELHSFVKDYCKDKGLILQFFVEEALREKLKKEQEKV